MLSRSIVLATSFALGLGMCASGAQAAAVLGSHVDSSVFSAAFGSTAGWSYLGQSTPAFSGSGTAELISRSSTYADTFGYSRTNYTGRVQVFGTGASAGATATVTGYDPGYLLYMQADGSDLVIFSDDNRQYTDGHSTGGNPGAAQGDIDIFHNVASNMWAIFFDDAGGGAFIAGDDNDYNDMIVSFRQAVPEPGALGLLGLGLLGLGLVWRRKETPKQMAPLAIA